jgi:hypothetical protein
MGGKRSNNGKPRLAFIPPASQELLAKALDFGANKYGDFNWRKAGPNFSLLSIMNSLERHLLAIKRGENNDEESGLPHIAHVLANAAFIAQLAEDGTLVDDRYVGEVFKKSKLAGYEFTDETED